MHPRSGFVALVVAGLLLVGCGQNSAPDRSPKAQKSDDGVQVGNGAVSLSSYYSPDYKFHFAFPPDFKLTEESRRHITVAARSEVSQNNRSLIRFRIFPGGDMGGLRIKDWGDLRAYVTNDCAGSSLTVISVSGIQGFSCSLKNETCFRSVNKYLFTPRKDVISVEIKGRDEAGLEEMEHVLASFIYDDQPPNVIALQLDRVTERGRVGLTVKVRDGLSGIMLKLQGKVVPDPAISGDSDGFSFAVSLTGDGSDIYHAEFELPSRFSEGTYVISELNLWDNLANGAKLSIQHSHQRVYLPPFENFEVIRFKTKAFRASDKIHPVIHDAALSVVSASLADGALLRFRATDNSGGIFRESTTWGELKQRLPDGKDVMIPIVGTAVAAGDNWYAIRFEISPFVPNGKYVLTHFQVQDTQGNRTSLFLKSGSVASLDERYYQHTDDSVVKAFPTTIRTQMVNVTNSLAEPHAKPPYISSLEIKPKINTTGEKTVTAGGSASICFTASNGGAGITPFMGYAGLLVSNFRTDTGKQTVIPIGGAVKQVSEHAYCLDFNIPLNSPPGEYFVQSFRIADNGRKVGKLYVPAQSGVVISTGSPRYFDANNKMTSVPLAVITVLKPSDGEY
ncbi:MAG: hypothetical protein HY537_18940 [Deltaproteobacteria bacterium]|nr:hypothetical protein [Deltaproteobacteria bacterium]